MRKVLLFLIFAFCLAPVSYAAPSYGIRLPKQKNFSTGIQSHTIFKRYLENESGKLRSTQNFLLLSYGVYDWLSLDLKGGAGFIKQHPVGSDEVDYPSYLGGGYGFRLKIYDDKKLASVLGFQHISIHPKTIRLEDVKNKAVLDDWQVSLLTSLGFKKITPYLGGRWSRVDYIHWRAGSRQRIKSDSTKQIGFIFGFDLPFSKNTRLNLEASLFDSESLAASINYSF